MKTALRFSTILLLFGALNGLHAQSWNSVVVTSLNIGTSTGYESAVDYQGIHVVYYNSGTLKFALLNSSGSVVRSDVTIDNSIGNYAAITARSGVLYAVYEKSGYVNVAKSTNAGANWDLTAIPHYSMNGYAMNGLDVQSDNRGVHVAWSETSNKVYYVRRDIDGQNPDWYDYKHVTDYSGGSGIGPTITFSNSRVHVSYYLTQGAAGVSTRDYIWPMSAWQDNQSTGGSYLPSGKEARIAVANAKLNCMYVGWDPYIQPYGRLMHFIRDTNGTTWTQQTISTNYANRNYQLRYSTTVDGKSHVVYYGKDDNGGNEGIRHRYWDGTSWSSPVSISLEFVADKFTLKSVGNDLFVVGTDMTISNRLTIQQYDAAPVKPQNLVAGLNPGDSKVRLTWNANPEPDMSSYEISRKVSPGGEGGSWSVIATTSNTYYVDSQWGYSGSTFDVSYKIRAKDINNHYSTYSDVVTCHPYPMGKTGYATSPFAIAKYETGESPLEFGLSIFPNPFNPTSSIKYGIPVDAYVTLNVYDVLGREVATLADGLKSAGNYSARLDGSRLSSGIYFARFSVTPLDGSKPLVETSKIMLMK